MFAFAFSRLTNAETDTSDAVGDGPIPRELWLVDGKMWRDGPDAPLLIERLELLIKANSSNGRLGRLASDLPGLKQLLRRRRLRERGRGGGGGGSRGSDCSCDAGGCSGEAGGGREEMAREPDGADGPHRCDACAVLLARSSEKWSTPARNCTDSVLR